MNKLAIKGAELEYLSHSGFIIRGGGKSVVIDPFLDKAKNPFARALPSSVEADDIIVTHGHADHIGESVEIAKLNNCKITAPFNVAKFLEAQGAAINPIAIGGTLKYGWEAHARYAMHSGLLPDGTDFGQAMSVLLTIGRARIYHLGDTALHADFKLVGEIYKPDIALIPIGGKFTMDIGEAAIAAKWLGAPVVVPMHYNTFDFIEADPVEFKKKVEMETSSECVVLEA
jgi:L-ascorbate metabolism protein UlaG (beta-lactamase superfamily)